MIIVAAMIGMVLHEYAHALVATSLGDPTPELVGRLTLNPLAHTDAVGSVLLPLALHLAGLPIVGWCRPMPVLPRDAWTAGEWITIHLAGPVANVLTALFFLTLEPLLGMGPVVVNLVLAAGNLLPLPWLDGGRILQRPSNDPQSTLE